MDGKRKMTKLANILNSAFLTLFCSGLVIVIALASQNVFHFQKNTHKCSEKNVLHNINGIFVGGVSHLSRLYEHETLNISRLLVKT